jgi:aryl-alcohol dehydrogenase-like predicted oxidoreductase
MDDRILERTGVKVSPMALGTDNFSANPNNTLTAAQPAILWVNEQPGDTAPLIGVRSMEQFEPLLAVIDMSLEDGLRAGCGRPATSWCRPAAPWRTFTTPRTG